MPQLDILTYQTQFFWVFSVFIFIYYIIARYVLPYFLYIITLRIMIKNLFTYHSYFLSVFNTLNKTNLTFLNLRNYFFLPSLGFALKPYLEISTGCKKAPIFNTSSYFCRPLLKWWI